MSLDNQGKTRLNFDGPPQEKYKIKLDLAMDDFHGYHPSKKLALHDLEENEEGEWHIFVFSAPDDRINIFMEGKNCFYPEVTVNVSCVNYWYPQFNTTLFETKCETSLNGEWSLEQTSEQKYQDLKEQKTLLLVAEVRHTSEYELPRGAVAEYERESELHRIYPFRIYNECARYCDIE